MNETTNSLSEEKTRGLQESPINTTAKTVNPCWGRGQGNLVEQHFEYPPDKTEEATTC
jgi:hypothetical protein